MLISDPQHDRNIDLRQSSGFPDRVKAGPWLKASHAIDTFSVKNDGKKVWMTEFLYKALHEHNMNWWKKKIKNVK